MIYIGVAISLLGPLARGGKETHGSPAGASTYDTTNLDGIHPKE